MGGVPTHDAGPVVFGNLQTSDALHHLPEAANLVEVITPGNDVLGTITLSFAPTTDTSGSRREPRISRTLANCTNACLHATFRDWILAVITFLRSSIAYLFVFTYLLLVGSSCVVLTALTGRPKLLFLVGRFAVRIGLFLTGIDYTVRGLEHIVANKNCIFVSNHCSNLDPLVIVLVTPRDVRIIAKKELSKIPILATALRLGNFVFVDRRKIDHALVSIDQATEIVRKGHSFLLFAEGTRSADGQLKPFKKGAFVLAIKSSTDIVPITIKGSYQSMPKGAFVVHPGHVEVTFHEPISTKGTSYEDRDRLMQQAYGIMSAALAEGSKDPAGS